MRERVPWSAHTCFRQQGEWGLSTPVHAEASGPTRTAFLHTHVGQALLGAFVSSFHLIALMGVYN